MFKEEEKTPTVLSHEEEGGVKLKVKLNVRNCLAIFHFVYMREIT
jgi:hypothetical protein